MGTGLTYSNLSNIKFSRQIYPDFFSYINKQDLLYEKFNQILEYLLGFLIKNFINNKGFCLELLNILNKLFDECNKLDYNDPVYAIAFTITHFLNRYHRFQKIGMKLFEKALLSLRINTDSESKKLLLRTHPNGQDSSNI